MWGRQRAARMSAVAMKQGARGGALTQVLWGPNLHFRKVSHLHNYTSINFIT